MNPNNVADEPPDTATLAGAPLEITGASKVKISCDVPTMSASVVAVSTLAPTPELARQMSLVSELHEVVAHTTGEENVAVKSSTPKFSPKIVTLPLPDVALFHGMDRDKTGAAPKTIVV